LTKIFIKKMKGGESKQKKKDKSEKQEIYDKIN
jgi:hypothetical protein